MQDKLTEVYSVKIPAQLRDLVRQLDPAGVKALNKRIRLEIAQVVHERVMFDHELYLTSDPAAVTRLLGKLGVTHPPKSLPLDEEDDE
jgi:hypothetical protein